MKTPPKRGSVEVERTGLPSDIGHLLFSRSFERTRQQLFCDVSTFLD